MNNVEEVRPDERKGFLPNRIILVSCGLVSGLLIALCVFLLSQVLGLQAHMDRLGDVLILSAFELHARDFASSPSDLHLLLPPDAEMPQPPGEAPPTGVQVHRFGEVPGVSDMSTDRWVSLNVLLLVCEPYNAVAASQACRLAVRGDRSARVVWTLKTFDDLHPNIDMREFIQAIEQPASADRSLERLRRLAMGNTLLYHRPAAAYFDTVVAPKEDMWSLAP